MGDSKNDYFHVYMVWNNGNVDDRNADTLAEAKQKVQEIFSTFGNRILHCHIFECKHIDTITFTKMVQRRHKKGAL